MTSAETGWMIRIINRGGEDGKEETERFTGNFALFGKRTLDEVVAFQGIYGNGDYMRWAIHKDQETWDFNVGDQLELRLYLDMNPAMCFFYENYKITNILTSNRRFTIVVGKSIDSLILESPIKNSGAQQVTIYNDINAFKREKEFIKFPIIQEHLIPRDEEVEYYKNSLTGKPLINKQTGKPLIRKKTIQMYIDEIKEIYNKIDPSEQNAYDQLKPKITEKRPWFSDELKERAATLLRIFGIEPKNINPQGLVTNPDSNKAVELIAEKFRVNEATQTQILKRMFEYIFDWHNIFTVCYHTNEHEDKINPKDINAFAYDPQWKMRDFINFYMDKFKFEWTVKDNVLHIGKELRAIEKYNSSRPELPADIITRYGPFMKIDSQTRPMLVLSHINKTYRCLWVKHGAGKNGGRTVAFLSRIGFGGISKRIYGDSLEGRQETEFWIKNTLPIKPTQVSKSTIYAVSEDPGTGFIQADTDDYDGVDGKEIENRMEESGTIIDHKIVTPYMEHLGGIFFPVPIKKIKTKSGNGYIEPNKIVKVTPAGDPSESYAIGHLIDPIDGQVDLILGDETKLKPPLKGERDFLLTLPKNKNDEYGPTLYLDGYYGKVLLQCEGYNPRVDEDFIPRLPTFENLQGKNGEEITNFFPYPKDGGSEVEDMNPNGQSKTYIYMRPKNTEASGEYEQISLNAGGEDGVKIRLRNLNKEGVEIWRGGNLMFRILKTKIQLIVGDTTMEIDNSGVDIT